MYGVVGVLCDKVIDVRRVDDGVMSLTIVF